MQSLGKLDIAWSNYGEYPACTIIDLLDNLDYCIDYAPYKRHQGLIRPVTLLIAALFYGARKEEVPLKSRIHTKPYVRHRNTPKQHAAHCNKGGTRREKRPVMVS
ncbi:unnamed protein product [Pylaiella littoralis]